MLHILTTERADLLAARPRRNLIGQAFGYLLLALRIRRERDHLAALTDDQLRDVGIVREDAEAEAARDLTDIPAHRKSLLNL